MNSQQDTKEAPKERACSRVGCATPCYALVGYMVTWDNETKITMWHDIRLAEREKEIREACGFEDVNIEKVYRKF